MKHLESFLLYILKSVLFFAFTFVLSLSFLQQKFPPSIGAFMQQMKTARTLYSANQSLLSKMDGKDGQLTELLNGNSQNIDELIKEIQKNPGGLNALGSSYGQTNTTSRLELSELKNKVHVSEQKIKQLEFDIHQLKAEIDYLKKQKSF